MSSFEPGEALLDTRFVPDTTATELPRFERTDADQTAEPEGEAELAERHWLQGYAAGRDAAREALPCAEAEALTRAAEALAGATEQLFALQRGSLAAQRSAVVELALAIAERILHRNLRADAGALEALVEHAAASLADEGPLQLQLSEADLAIVAEERAPRLAALRAAGELALSPSTDLQPGEFRLQAGSAEVDGRIDSLLGIVREGLDECLAQCDDAGNDREGSGS